MRPFASLLKPTLFLSAVLGLVYSLSRAQTSSSPPVTSKLSSRPDISEDYAFLAKAPEKAQTRHNPFEGNSNAIAAGRKLFVQHCAQCHGNDAGGGNKAPSLRSDEVQQATAGTLFWVLTNGVVRRGMPVWSKLPEPQRWQIVTYILSLKAPGQPISGKQRLDKWGALNTSHAITPVQ